MCDGIPDRCGRISGTENIRELLRRTVIRAAVSGDDIQCKLDYSHLDVSFATQSTTSTVRYTHHGHSPGVSMEDHGDDGVRAILHIGGLNSKLDSTR